jgi:hypothetical protein
MNVRRSTTESFRPKTTGSSAILRLQGGFARFGDYPVLADEQHSTTALEAQCGTDRSWPISALKDNDDLTLTARSIRVTTCHSPTPGAKSANRHRSTVLSFECMLIADRPVSTRSSARSCAPSFVATSFGARERGASIGYGMRSICSLRLQRANCGRREPARCLFLDTI